MDKLSRKQNYSEKEWELSSYYDDIITKPIVILPMKYDTSVHLSLESAIVLWILKTLKIKCVEINLVHHQLNSNEAIFTFKKAFLQDVTLIQSFESLNENNSLITSLSNFPCVIVKERSTVICGLSSVLRFCIKKAFSKSKQDTQSQITYSQLLTRILGFRDGCLQACAEVSVWTKFCEYDIINCVYEEVSSFLKFSDENVSEFPCIPRQLYRFEYHLNKPVKIHNERKELALMESDDGKSGNGLPHEFAEGPFLTLADLILYPCIYMLQKLLSDETMKSLFPKIIVWLTTMDTVFCIRDSGFNCVSVTHVPGLSYHKRWLKLSRPILTDVPNESLYKSDHERYKPSKRVFTRDHDVETAIAAINGCGINIINFSETPVNSNKFSWNEIPMVAKPEGGKLPPVRLQRKCEQLSSLMNEIVSLVDRIRTTKPDSCIRIVDFCSGGGHLGILVAWLYRDNLCHVTLVENKEQSLIRASRRVSSLGLNNVTLFQGNLDYYNESFDLGIALHACGSATDLVLKKCMDANACFICSPCCYGAVKENHNVVYPRSEVFQDCRSFSTANYFTLAHASDHTHDDLNEKTEQGRFCMRVIDTDRACYARQLGYSVSLSRISPYTASPKNHILVGISPNL